MLMRVYTVYDSKTEAYMPPFFQPAKGAALRLFSDSVNDVNHTFNKHPSDFTLFELGTYDDSTAQFVTHSTPISLGLALEFVRQD